jgi:hypothetical protein
VVCTWADHRLPPVKNPLRRVFLRLQGIKPVMKSTGFSDTKAKRPG